MKVKQEGEGHCNCGSPRLTAIGRGPVCLACEEAKKPKTGRTFVVTGETGDGVNGTVTGYEVENNMNVQVSTMIAKPTGTIRLEFTLEDLGKPNILLTIMQALYDGIDNMPPPTTIKETKKAIALQEIIQSQIKKLKGE